MQLQNDHTKLNNISMKIINSINNNDSDNGNDDNNNNDNDNDNDNQSNQIKHSFIDKKDNPPDTNASGFYRRVGVGRIRITNGKC